MNFFKTLTGNIATQVIGAGSVIGILTAFANHLDPQLVATLNGYGLSPTLVVIIAIAIFAVKTLVAYLASKSNPDGTPATEAWDGESK